MWMIRAGRGGENVEDFLRLGVATMGDTRLTTFTATFKKDDILRLYAEKYPEEKEVTRAVWASQLTRFIHELKVGDEVATFDRERRKYLLGQISSDYEWKPGLIPDMPHVRQIKWRQEVSRDELSTATKNTLGAIMTLFKLGPDVEKGPARARRPAR